MYAPGSADGKGKEEDDEETAGPLQGIDSLQSFLRELAQAEPVATAGGVAFRMEQTAPPPPEVGGELLEALQEEMGRLLRMAKPETREEQERLRAAMAEQVEDVLRCIVEQLRQRFAAQGKVNAAELQHLELDRALGKQDERNAQLLAHVEERQARVAQKKKELAAKETRERQLRAELGEAEEEEGRLDEALAASRKAGSEQEAQLAASQERAQNKRDALDKEREARAEVMEAIRAVEEERDVLKKQVENLRQQARNTKLVGAMHANVDGTKHKEEVLQLRSQLESSQRALQQVGEADREVAKLRQDRVALLAQLDAAQTRREALEQEKAAMEEKVYRLMEALRRLTRAHKDLKDDLENEKQRSVSYDQEASMAKEAVNNMLDDVIHSLEQEKTEIRRRLRTASQL